MVSVYLFALTGLLTLPAQAEHLTLVSWNVDNFAAADQSLRGRTRSSKERWEMHQVLVEQNADIIALQEVASVNAAQGLLGPEYHVKVEARCYENQSRCQSPGDSIYTAIAWRKTFGERYASVTPFQLPQLAVRHTDECGLERLVRGGVGVRLEGLKGRVTNILSVHLKAACKDDKIEGGTADDCATQEKQFEVLRAWTEQRRSANEAVVIAGDLNRRLLDRRDSQRLAWESRFADDLLILPQGERACWRDAKLDVRTLKLDALQKHREFLDQNRLPWIYHPKHTAVVDHFIISGLDRGAKTVAKQISLASRQSFGEVSDYVIRNCDGTLRTDLAFVQSNPSDHCPIKLTIQR